MTLFTLLSKCMTLAIEKCMFLLFFLFIYLFCFVLFCF